VRLRTSSGVEGWSAGAAVARERDGLGSLLGPYLLDERADDIPSVRQRIREMGYLAETWQIVKRVAAAGARYTPHTWTNGVGFAVNLQLHAASPFRETTLLEYPYDPPAWVPWARDGILEAPWRHERGALALPTAPGLGFTVSRRALRRWGRHFFRATRRRMAASAILQGRIRAAREARAIRAARLAERDRVITSERALGREPWQDATA
jgi:L-alanine-DL-glutamate epimerase-like enolase superfamily enzyme